MVQMSYQKQHNVRERFPEQGFDLADLPTFQSMFTGALSENRLKVAIGGVHSATIPIPVSSKCPTKNNTVVEEGFQSKEFDLGDLHEFQSIFIHQSRSASTLKVAIGGVHSATMPIPIWCKYHTKINTVVEEGFQSKEFHLGDLPEFQSIFIHQNSISKYTKGCYSRGPFCNSTYSCRVQMSHQNQHSGRGRYPQEGF